MPATRTLPGPEPTTATQGTGTVAATLMRHALELLDKAGETLAAVHLQHAISVLEREPIPVTIEEADAALRALDDR